MSSVVIFGTSEKEIIEDSALDWLNVGGNRPNHSFL